MYSASIYAKTATILIVDDNRANLGLLYRLLVKQGHRVLIARNAATGIEIASGELPDIILLDIMLPDQSGFDLCRDLKKSEITQHIPVLFISALSEIDDKLEGFQAGGVDFITKPFHPDEVRARVSTHLTLIRQRQELESVNQTKNRLLSIIAHDIRGPIAGFQGIASVIDHAVQTEDTHSLSEISDAIDKSATSTLQLLENLLEWARSQETAGDLKRERVELEPLTTEILDIHRGIAEQKSVQLAMENIAGAVMSADRHMLATIIRNLVANAVKFCRAGDSVTVSFYTQQNYSHIAVSDTGIGMDQEHIDTLFTIDKQTKTRGTHGESSSGFGLLLVKEYIDAHSGSITVNSTPGKGSVFTVRLPND